MGLCDDLRPEASKKLLVLWQHAVCAGEAIYVQVHPRRKVLSLLVCVGRGRVCRATEERSELRMDFKLTNLQGQIHLRCDPSGAIIERPSDRKRSKQRGSPTALERL